MSKRDPTPPHHNKDGSIDYDGTIANAVKHCLAACMICVQDGNMSAHLASVWNDGIGAIVHSGSAGAADGMDWQNDLVGIGCCMRSASSTETCLSCCLRRAASSSLSVVRGVQSLTAYEARDAYKKAMRLKNLVSVVPSFGVGTSTTEYYSETIF